MTASSTDADCLLVGLGDLDFVRRHPALGFSLAVKLENIDPRTVPSMFGPLMPRDARYGEAKPSGDMQSVVLRRPGRFVSQAADLLQRFDAEAGRTVVGPGPEGVGRGTRTGSKR